MNPLSVTQVQLGDEVEYHVLGIHVASALPPRPHDAPHQWRALDCEGRAVEVDNREIAMRWALAYAEGWARRKQEQLIDEATAGREAT